MDTHARAAVARDARLSAAVVQADKFELSPEQIRSYRTKGFIVLEDILNAAQLALWREVIDTAVRERGKNRFHYGSEDHTNVNPDYYDKVFTQRVNLWRTSDATRALLAGAAAAVGRAACALEGVSSMRVWHDQALYKEPFANPTSWHVDNPYWSFSSPNAISVWIALDDATAVNGCMHMLPGSHTALRTEFERKGEYEEIKIGANMADVFAAVPALDPNGASPLRPGPPVAVPMRAGSCSLHNGLTVHAAGPNMTHQRRRAMTIQMMPGGMHFNGRRNVLTESEFAVLKLGDSLDCDVRNPLMWANKH